MGKVNGVDGSTDVLICVRVHGGQTEYCAHLVLCEIVTVLFVMRSARSPPHLLCGDGDSVCCEHDQIYLLVCPRYTEL
jgi:hypothetical protein